MLCIIRFPESFTLKRRSTDEKGINGLSALSEAVPTDIKDAVGATPHLRYFRGFFGLTKRSWDPPPVTIYPRGKAYFTTLYSPAHAPKIIANMAATHPDLPVFAINHLYSGVISDTTILDAPSSVLVNFSATVATDSAPQAKGHIHGCRNFGVDRWEIQSAIKAITVIAEEVRRAGGPRVAWETMGFLKRFGGKVPGDEGWEEWVWDENKDENIKAKL
jgi:alkylhydroperoxidase/carboxymuconolactone decarboxylase family protein YurZ